MTGTWPTKLWWGHHKAFYEPLLQMMTSWNPFRLEQFILQGIKNIFFALSRRSVEQDVFGGQFVSQYF